MKNLVKIIIAMATIASVGSAYAVGTLTLFDGTTTITVPDQGSGDSNPAVGVVTFIGSIGVWNINVDTGTTKPAVIGQMDLAFLASATGAGTLTITFSDTGFGGLDNLLDVFGGTRATNASITDQILVNGVAVITLGPFGTGSTTFSGSGSALGVDLSPSDVVSLVVTITEGTGGGLNSGDKNLGGLTVPDGGSAVALLGIALTGIEAARRLFRARRA